MSYFQKFPFVPYNFGEANQYALHQNLSIYVDILDQVKNNSSFYQKYVIQDGERPDTLSQKIYDSPKYYWSFFLVNDNIRQQGWPLSFYNLDEFIKKSKSNKVLQLNRPPHHMDINTESEATIWDFEDGVTWHDADQTNTFSKIISRDFDLNQVVIEPSVTLNGALRSVTAPPKVLGEGHYSCAPEYDSISHYVDDNNIYVDLYDAKEKIPVTHYERLTAENESLKSIVIIKPDVISSLYDQFQEAVRS